MFSICLFVCITPAPFFVRSIFIFASHSKNLAISFVRLSLCAASSIREPFWTSRNFYSRAFLCAARFFFFGVCPIEQNHQNAIVHGGEPWGRAIMRSRRPCVSWIVAPKTFCLSFFFFFSHEPTLCFRLWFINRTIFLEPVLGHKVFWKCRLISKLAFARQDPPRGCIEAVIFTWGELVRSVSDTRIFIDLHLPRLTHLHDARRLSCVRCVSVWMRLRGSILKSSRSPDRSSR